MINLRYDVIGADLDYGIRVHPQLQMWELGLEVVKSEPCPIADCWFFRISNSAENLPGYLTVLSNCFKFADEY